MRASLGWLVALLLVGCSPPPRREERRETARAPAPRALIRTCIALRTGAVAAVPLGDESKPAAQQDPPTPGAGLPKAEIRRVIRERLPEVRRCYETELVNRPELSGKTTARFTIAPDGSVTRSTADGFDPAVDACVAKVMATLRFPPPVGVVNVNYPFIFKLTEGKPIAGLPGPSRDEGLLERVSKPGCRTVVPPAALVAAQKALDGCAREAGPSSSRADLVVVLKNTASVTGPEPVRGCVDRELASIAPVAPTTSCTIAIGDPAAISDQPAIGSETDCPAALR